MANELTQGEREILAAIDTHGYSVRGEVAYFPAGTQLSQTHKTDGGRKLCYYKGLLLNIGTRAEQKIGNRTVVWYRVSHIQGVKPV
ncbi:MAG: hypothetical protein QY314_02575 [Candidatus Dojkabacteria bacterium]|nr:MAG: hypothetical protein QY314_02575 [Candidatus Dojkabacteria bacterium]